VLGLTRVPQSASVYRPRILRHRFAIMRPVGACPSCRVGIGLASSGRDHLTHQLILVSDFSPIADSSQLFLKGATSPGNVRRSCTLSPKQRLRPLAMAVEPALSDTDRTRITAPAAADFAVRPTI
jgi:hypothetical protein